MAPRVNSVVLRTQYLSTTKLFFESCLGLRIKEASAKHFVLHTKGLRLVFLDSDSDFGIELYVDVKKESPTTPGCFQDPNGIRIFVRNV